MKLKKSLSTLDIFCISSGTMISSGIFVLPSLAFSKAGPAVFIAYLLAGLAAMIGSLSIIELSTAMPKAGGDYYFISKALGPLVGLISGLFSWFSLSLKTAFAIFGLTELTLIFFGGNFFLIALGFTLFFTILNIIGIDFAAKFEIFIVLFLIIIMLLYVVKGISHIDVFKFIPFSPHGKHSIFLTAGFVFVSFGGLLKIACISEEVKNPAKSIPIGIISSIIFVTLLYVFLVVVVVGTLDAKILLSSFTPVADSAKLIFGNKGYFWISVAASLAFISTANAGIMSASRYPIALSRDNLIPSFFASVNKKFQTPYLSIILTGIFILLFLLLNLEVLVKIASSIIITSYILTNFSIIIIKESKMQNYAPTFKAPFYPWIQIISILIFAWLIFEIGIAIVEISLFTIAACLILYFLYARKKNRKEYALLHIIERVINKKITGNNLEEELKTILMERDDIHKDEFDKIIEENSFFLDMEEQKDLKEFFDYIALHFSENFEIAKDKFLELLLEREKENSTAINNFLALPHIVLEKENIFKIIVVRSKTGIKFSQEKPSIKAIFLIFGSKNKRNLHLKTIAAIAQISQNIHFEKKWLEAKNEEQLKNLILLSKRNRNKKNEN